MDDGKLVPATILVVDDEPSICWAFERLFREEGHQVLVASSAEDGLQLASVHSIDLLMLDVRLPKQDGISALPSFLEIMGNAPVIIMTAFGDLDTAVAAVRNGASDYITKPFGLDDVLFKSRRALENRFLSQQKFKGVSKASGDNDQIVGRSESMQVVFRQIALVSDSDLSVLITGETGTGKELVGSAIHRHSRRSDKAYLAIAPAALNAELIESELFGHVKGAFTGASEDRAGLFEKAEGGTILLDEIGELPLGIQVKLLRVLEQGDYCRVGETKSRKCNVRIIAATNRDLQKAVTEGVFREDLYFRLNGLQIRLPALRERIEDMGILSTHFLTKVQYPEGSRVLSDKLLEQLSRRDWPGNIRQLRNAIEHAAVNARGRSLVIEDFPPEQPLSKEGSRSDGVDLESLIKEFVEQEMKKGDGSSVKLHERLLERIEPILLLSVLRESQGNKIKAAEMLGIHRGTLRERLKHYRIED